MKKFTLRNEKYISIYSAFLAILGGLLVGLLLLLSSNPSQALPAFFTMITAGFSDFGNVIYYSTPIIITGLAIAFAFKTGLFNIGATGQMILGSYVAIYIGVEWTFLGPFQWVVATIFAGLAGGVWAFIPGYLKAKKGIHEVVTSIMMNYIALFFVNFLIVRTVYNDLLNMTLPVKSTIPKFGLDKLFPYSNAQGGFLIAVIAVIVIYYILNKTKLGFELKAVGFNKDASKYAGINEKSSIIKAFVISGILAGLAGAVIYLTSVGKYISVVDVMPSEGFMGISVALLGFSEPIGVFLAGLFFGYLKVGGQYMQMYDFSVEIISIITGTIVYFSALIVIFQGLARKWFKLRKVER